MISKDMQNPFRTLPRNFKQGMLICQVAVGKVFLWRLLVFKSHLSVRLFFAVCLRFPLHDLALVAPKRDVVSDYYTLKNEVFHMSIPLPPLHIRFVYISFTHE